MVKDPLVPERSAAVWYNKRMLLRIFAFLFLLAGAVAPREVVEKGDSFREARREMVEEQLRARGIEDHRVLEVMGKVPRERFVPLSLQKAAYADGPLPIGEGQTISQPYIVALMTELLEPSGGGKVLEIGTGSGYQAAVLAEMGIEVYTMEILPALSKRASRILEDLGYHHIHVKTGNGYLGWPEEAPFDAILVTAAPEFLPRALVEQLKVGGVLVIPIGPSGDQVLWQIRKTSLGLKKRTIIPVSFVPMVEALPHSP